MSKDPAASGNADGEGVFIEIVTLGGIAKVTAIDAATGTEVSVQVPAHASRAAMESAALQKLRYVLKKKSETR